MNNLLHQLMLISYWTPQYSIYSFYSNKMLWFLNHKVKWTQFFAVRPASEGSIVGVFRSWVNMSIRTSSAYRAAYLWRTSTVHRLRLELQGNVEYKQELVQELIYIFWNSIGQVKFMHLRFGQMVKEYKTH